MTEDKTEETSDESSGINNEELTNEEKQLWH